MNSTSLQLDQQQANHLNKHGGTLLCWDVPAKIYFGIDYLTFETGTKFKGVKLIPPGAHFIHTSVHSVDRMGFFIWINSKQIDVYQWDKSLQFLTDFEDPEQWERLRIGVRNFDFDSNLGAYPLQTFSKWQKLCNHITAPLIQRLGPKSGVMTSTYSEMNGTSVSNGHHHEEDQEMKDIDGDDDGGNVSNAKKYESYNSAKFKFEHYHPSYTKIPTISAMKGLSPSERTTLQMDRSKILYDLLNGPRFKEDHFALIGELQYAFICLLVGQSVQGLEQWKVIIDLICNCCDALEEKQEFYAGFIAALIVQLGELPQDFFRDQLMNKNFLNQSLQSLMEIVNESQIGEGLMGKVKALKDILSERFDKTFDLDDEGPVVVSL